MANNTIKEGMFIEGKHVTVRKMLSEPWHCLKCQKFRHHVPDCAKQTKTAVLNVVNTTTLCNAMPPTRLLSIVWTALVTQLRDMEQWIEIAWNLWWKNTKYWNKSWRISSNSSLPMTPQHGNYWMIPDHKKNSKNKLLPYVKQYANLQFLTPDSSSNS
jgi:hypothetical protein